MKDTRGAGAGPATKRAAALFLTCVRLLIFPGLLLALLSYGGGSLHAQQPPVQPGVPAPTTSPPPQQPSKVPPGGALPSYDGVEQQPRGAVHPVPVANTLSGWAGLHVEEVRFEGVTRATLDPLPQQLEQQPNAPLDPLRVRGDLRRLYATGLYNTIAVDGERRGDSVILIYRGTPTLFIGRVSIHGIQKTQLSNQLSYSTRLNPGTPYSESKINRAASLLQETLQENGFYQGKVARHTAVDKTSSEMNIEFAVQTGKPARVGDVTVQGDSGMAVPTFRKKARLREGAKVTSETVTHALNNLRKTYKKQQRLEAVVSLASRQYRPATNRLNLDFHADRGPIVRVIVEGAKLSRGKVRNLVPVFGEGSLDEDLLNEGSKRIRDYFQRQGYFNAKVTYSTSANDGVTHIAYDVSLGPRDRIESVSVTGNHYFGSWLIRQRLGVQSASLFVPHGTYSVALQQADVNAITALYQSNGFTKVKVDPEVRALGPPGRNGQRNLAIAYKIDEGIQQKVGIYDISGVTPVQREALEPKLSLQAGQPYSGSNLAADRDAILGYFVDNGYDHARVNLKQNPDPRDANLVDVHIAVVPGDQIFIRNILISGLHYTRPSTVRNQILVHPGQPLDQAKIIETQRQLYNLTLFNQVNTAVENPAGDELRKNVLVQFYEARRWDVVYGAGLQAQTGTPSTNCPNAISLIQLGINPSSYTCSPNGRFGVSALAQLNLSRINLWGRNQTFSFHSQYGTLEQEITGEYTAPSFLNHPTLNFSFGGGYINAQNVITFASSTTEGDVRLTQHPRLPETFIYELTYRRVKVDPNTIQVAPDLIPLLSEPVRIGGPELTWIRDTRRPEPLDARAGMYNSIQEFATDHSFLDSQANFNHFDWTNSTYYQIGRHKSYVLARNTRFGMERVYGEGKYESIPLPERLYAGGPESLRGFPLNSAGPRDSLTGFPIGGAGVFVNQTELRMPPPQLPYVGRSVAFVLFEDMGNVFNNSSDIWSSALRVRQPHTYTCTAPQYLTAAAQEQVTRSSSTNTTGTCDFNDFSQTVGMGARYHTPIGPIRLDLGYNLNPPVYPVIVTYGTPSPGTCVHGDTSPCYGQASHFNFFFSIGQAF